MCCWWFESRWRWVKQLLGQPSAVSAGWRRTSRHVSYLYDELWIGVGETLELILVQIHDEEFVCGRQFHRHLCELLVKVANVAARFLPHTDEKQEKIC